MTKPIILVKICYNIVCHLNDTQKHCYEKHQFDCSLYVHIQLISTDISKVHYVLHCDINILTMKIKTLDL